MAEIRRACAGDIPGILNLLVQVDMVHHIGRPDLFKGPAVKYGAEELAELLQDEKRPVFVYIGEDGKVCGHAFCVHQQVQGSAVLTDVRTLYVDDICVDEQCRGQKIGTALWETVRAYAKEQGFYNITLNVWACNPGAQAFYEQMGLKPQKTCMELLL